MTLLPSCVVHRDLLQCWGTLRHGINMASLADTPVLVWHHMWQQIQTMCDSLVAVQASSGPVICYAQG